MADAALATSNGFLVTLSRWYHFSCRVYGTGSEFRVRLRYDTEAVDEHDSGPLATNSTWMHYGHCFQAQYTDESFVIILSSVWPNATVKFDNVVFKEVLLEAGADFKYDYNEAYRESTWKRLNNQGLVFPIITASDFRVKIKATDYRVDGLYIDSAKARYKLVDKRGIRGLYNAY